MEKTLGEKRVRVDFNPSKEGIVDQIKQKSAELINLIDSIPVPEVGPLEEIGIKGEIIRLKALAMTDIENAAMWGVKAATM